MAFFFCARTMRNMDFMHALVLGIVEGVTEFLPISSTGHLMLVSELLRIPNTEFLKTFEIVIQLGAILAVVVLYPKRLFVDRASMLRIVVAFIPTGIIGLLLHKVVKQYLFGNISLILWAFAIGGVVIILFERYVLPARQNASGEGVLEDLPLQSAAWIGVIQTLALIPGVSRSAATIFGGMYFGLSRAAAVEFSFLLAVPVMAAATALDLLKSHALLTDANWSALGFGFLAAFVVALLAIKFLVRFVKTHTFVPFAYYRIFIALIGFFIFF